MATIAAAVPRRIGPVRTFKHTWALAWRAVLKIRHNPEQLLDVTLQPIIFVTMFVYLFGGQMGGGDRHGYLEYVLPGILVQTIVFAGMGTATNLNTDITKGIFDRFRSLPIARSSPLTGLVVGDLVRIAVSSLVATGYGAILGFRFHTNILSVLAAYGLCTVFALSLSWVWVLLGLFVSSPQTLQGLGFVVLFPLTFASNVFVSATSLPGWLQGWVHVNPVSQLVNAARGLMLGSPVFTPAWHALVWCAVFVVVFAPIAVSVYRRKT
jgi:oleandomycin transport system permease protein